MSAPSRQEILGWLCEASPARLERLFAEADRVREERVGDEVHLRGLVEASNHCRRQCAYCGIRAGNGAVDRYRMSAEEVLEAARDAERFGYGTVVIQAGEDPGLTKEWISGLVGRIKATTSLAVTLSLGERSPDELAAWREAGADRYLLRFETSDRALFERIHPPAPGQGCSDRVERLRQLRALGYEVGSGVMVGIPGQTVGSLADDLALFAALDLDMIGLGPFIAHPGTPLGSAGPASFPAKAGAGDAQWGREGVGALDASSQAPATESMVYKVLALARLVRPDANIPSTTALATINKANGRELGLARGANVVMPNLTPPAFRAKYEIYPGKVCVHETAEACNGCLAARIRGLNRRLGKGPGGRRQTP